MKIAILGAGAMGSIYGCHLSKDNDVCLIDTNEELVKTINSQGIILQENGQDNVYHLRAVTSASNNVFQEETSCGDMEEADLIIVFVKALYSYSALENNKNIIGNSTYIMSLQNGSGHEEILKKFVPIERIIIGTTEDNGAILKIAHVRHGGKGVTNVGMLVDDKKGFLNQLKLTFDQCGFVTRIHTDIQKLVWDKLFINVSISVLTGLLQVNMGYITENENAWFLAKRLVKEAVAVANGLGLDFDEESILEKVRTTSLGSKEGYTSMYADIKAGRKTEVDTISGSVVRAAKSCGVPAPTHEFVVAMIHAMEER